MIWLAQRQPKLASEAAWGRQISHNPIARNAAKPTRASLDIPIPDPAPAYFLRRSLRTRYTAPTPPASSARLDGSGTALGPTVAPAKAAVVAAQVARSAIRETGTKRL